MKNRGRFILIIVSCLAFFPGEVVSQVAIGEWRTHISYNKIISVTSSSDAVYAASERGIQVYHKENNNLQTLSTVDGLAGANISEIYYSSAKGMLVVGYSSGNLDVLKNSEITNYPQIFEQTYHNQKSINHIIDFDEMILLATDFGIVEFLPEGGRFGDTYNVEEGQIIPVFEITYSDDYIYAATNQGVYFAEQNSILTQPSNWYRMDFLTEFDQPFNTIEVFDNKLIVNYNNGQGKDKVYAITDNSSEQLITDAEGQVNKVYSSSGKLYIASDNALSIYDSQFSINETIEQITQGNLNPLTVYTENSSLWIGDTDLGLLKRNSNGQFQSYKKNGPPKNDLFRVVSSKGSVFFIGGGYDGSFEKRETPAQISTFEEKRWENYEFSDFEDLASLAVDPGDVTHKFTGSWGDGLIEFDEFDPVNVYDESNSVLSASNAGDVRVRNLFFDNERNLWMINHQTQHSVIVKTAGDKWVKHEYDVLSNAFIKKMIPAENGFIWGILPNKKSVFVIDDNDTPSTTEDDVVEIKKPVDKNGTFYDHKNDDIYAIAEDRKGYIWLATEAGILVETNPAGYFQENSFQPARVRISEDGNSGYMLRDHIVTDIVVDPGNRKWFGTERSGVFLFSEEGDKMIHHFSEENSPLLSNEVLDIEMEETTGELFVITKKGVISYRTEASESKDDFKDAYVFPNPVKPDYEGPVTITGLMDGVNVKITDISGNLVYETVSDGGQALWHGRDLSGQKVSSGVYLVFITNEDGSKTHIEKILFIK